MATPRRSDTKEKKRALPTEFERQVSQIRADITTVRANLQRAEAALASVPASASETAPSEPAAAATASGTSAAAPTSGSAPGSSTAGGPSATTPSAAATGTQVRSSGADMLAEVLVSDGNAAAAAAAAARGGGVKQEVLEEKSFTG